jgi:hypothetical protein
MIASDWAAYAQVAKGFLAPNENFFNFSKTGSPNITPELDQHQPAAELELPARHQLADPGVVAFGGCLLHQFLESDRL